MDIDLYVDEGYWDDGYTFGYITPSPPSWATIPVTSILPSYLYQEYRPDDDIESFFLAYNAIAQGYMSYLVGLNLPVWTSDTISGTLLDWVALNLYGFSRPVLATPVPVLLDGVYNSADYNTVPYNQGGVAIELITAPVNDDIFKRCLTWNLYKGDGFQFNARWLKNRIQRFLGGTNGFSSHTDNTYNVSVTYGADNAILITINPVYATFAQILQNAIAAGVLNLPFQYTYSVTY